MRIHAEKDYDLKVKNVKNERIDFDHQVSIGNDERIDVANDRTITVEGEQHYTTKGAHIELREADSSLEIKGDLIEKVAGMMGERVEGDLTLESKTKITLKIGGSFLVIDQSGVYIDGPITTVNSGGTPGDTAKPLDPRVLAAAVGAGEPFVSLDPYNRKIQFVDDDGIPYDNEEYIAYLEDGTEVEGITDDKGYTEVFYSYNPEEVEVRLKIDNA